MDAATSLPAIKPPGGVSRILRHLARNWSFGRLTVRLPGGSERILVGDKPGPNAQLHLLDYGFARRVLGSGDIGFAEAYMAGEWDTPDLAALLEVLALNHDGIRRLFAGSALVKAANWVRHRFKRNTRSGAKSNIHAHYDLGNAFYSEWLDRSMTYSAAIYLGNTETLEAAQARKYQALARTMELGPGMKVLEIGCGWGGFAEYAANQFGVHVTGVTLSREQHAFATQRMVRAGLADRVDIQLVDYRDVTGRFDRVASIEMFEAVGQEYWPAYFNKIAEVLEPGGKAGLQIITIDDALFGGGAKRTDFIQKYIFPGGMLPSEAALKPVIERAGLTWAAIERYGPSYAETLAEWDRRFQAAWPRIARMGFDERFRRLWRFYLAYCEAGFRSGRTDVVQLVLTGRGLHAG